MLQFKIRQKIEAEGNFNPFTYLLTYCNLSRRKAQQFSTHTQKSISLKDLSMLCEQLNCTPNDLFYWEQKPTSTLPATHPCVALLTPPPEVSNFKKLLKQIDHTEVSDVFNYIQNKIKK